MATLVGQVILSSDQGGLVSINQRGRILWQWKPVSKDHEVRRILFSDNEILVAHLNSVERVDPATGRTKSRIHSFGTLRDIEVDASNRERWHLGTWCCTSNGRFARARSHG